MLLEAYKPLILRKVWLLGFASAAFTLVLMYIMYQTRHSAMSVLSLMSSIGLLAASVVGWWTCNNKKDDLNMLRSVEHFQKLLENLKKAESRLRGALDTMIAADKDMSTLEDDIKEAQQKIQASLADMKAKNQKYMDRQRRYILNDILVDVVDVNHDDQFDRLELQRLFVLLKNMSDQPDEKLHEVKAAIERLPENSSRQAVLDVLHENDAFQLIMGLEDDYRRTSTASERSPASHMSAAGASVAGGAVSSGAARGAPQVTAIARA